MLWIAESFQRYTMMGGKIEGDEREREERGIGQSNGTMIFVYAWSLIMFIGLTIYGWRKLTNGQDRMGLIVALLIFCQFSLLNLLTTVQGAIETDNAFFENSVYGWYGQHSVLVAYSDFWMMLHCFIFAGLLGLLRCLDRKAAQEVADESCNVHEDYHDDPVLTDRATDDYREYA